MNYVKAYIATILSFLVIDAVWIALVVRSYYDSQIPELLRESPEFVSAGIFYLAYAAAVVALAVKPALASQRVKDALINGAILGAVAYGTYTVTNFAVLKGWTVGLVVSDIAWGAFLTAVVAACGYLAARR